jgi:hypothetical protein
MRRASGTSQVIPRVRDFTLSSLRGRLLLLVLVGAVPALSLALRTAFEWRRDEVREVRDEALALARLVAGNEERTIAIGREGLLGLSRFPAECFTDSSDERRSPMAPPSGVS